MNTSLRFLLAGGTVALFAGLTAAGLAENQTPPAPPAAPSAPAVAPAATEAVRPEMRRLDVAEPSASPKIENNATVTEAKPETGQPAEPARRPGRNRVVPSSGSVSRGANDRVNFFGNAYVAEDEAIAGDIVAIMGDAIVAGAVRNDAVAVMGDLTVNGTVDGDAVAVMGDNKIDGAVHGDVVAVMGDITLGPRAVVDGKIVCVNGDVHRSPTAVVNGGIVKQSIGPGLKTTIATPFGAWWQHGLKFGRPLAIGAHLAWLWIFTACTFVLYVLMALIFPRGIRKCGDMLVQRPVLTILSALLSTVALPLLFVLLLVTIVGIPVALLVLPLGIVLLTLFGKASIYALVGRGLTADRLHPALAVLLGGAVFVLLFLVPVLGIMISLLMSFLGFGCCITALFTPGDKPAAAVPPPPVPPQGPAPTAPAVPPPATHATSAPVNLPLVAPVAPTVSSPPAPEIPAGIVAPPPVPPAPLPAADFAAGVVAAPPAAGADAGVVDSGPGSASPATGLSSAAETAAGVAPLPVMPAAPAPAASTVVSPPVPSVSAATLPRAGFKIRFGAMLIDLLLIAVLFAWMGTGAFLLFFMALYAALMWRFKTTTIGGIVCGLKVVRLDDRPLDWSTAIVRSLSCCLSLLPLGLGFIWVAFDSEKQSWHDKIAGTTVVKVPKSMSLV